MKIYMITLIDVEKSIDKIQYPEIHDKKDQ